MPQFYGNRSNVKFIAGDCKFVGQSGIAVVKYVTIVRGAETIQSVESVAFMPNTLADFKDVTTAKDILKARFYTILGDGYEPSDFASLAKINEKLAKVGSIKIQNDDSVPNPPNAPIAFV